MGNKVQHHLSVSASVVAALLAGGYIHHVLNPAGGGSRGYVRYGETPGFKGAVELTLGADNVDTAGGYRGSTRHGEGARSSILEMQQHGLVVHNIRFTAVNTAAVWVVRLAQQGFLWFGCRTTHCLPSVEDFQCRVCGRSRGNPVLPGSY